LCIKRLEEEIKVRDELIVAVQSCMLNEIGHCTTLYCTEDKPCRDCKDRRHILELIDNPGHTAKCEGCGKDYEPEEPSEPWTAVDMFCNRYCSPECRKRAVSDKDEV